MLVRSVPAIEKRCGGDRSHSDRLKWKGDDRSRTRVLERWSEQSAAFTTLFKFVLFTLGLPA